MKILNIKIFNTKYIKKIFAWFGILDQKPVIDWWSKIARSATES